MSTAETTTLLARELRAICGAEHVVEDPASFGQSPSGWMPHWFRPSLAVLPGSPEEIAAVLKFANQSAVSVVPAGGFAYQHPRFKAPQALVLYTSRLTAVQHYDPGDLTIGVGAGRTIADLSARVAKDGLLFAGDPRSPECATVGGLLATNMTGPLRHGFGGPRDYCIGIRFVTGDGRIAKGGGRVVKNVAGYDLMKLLIGSQGTLAVITSASFKLFPAPRQTRTFIAEFATPSEAIRFRDLTLRSPLSPLCLELASPRALTRLRAGWSESWLICARACGSDQVLARYRSELGPSVTRELECEAEIQWWRAVQRYPLDASGCHEMEATIEEFEERRTFEVSVPLQQIGPAIESLRRLTPHLSVMGRVGVGHLLISVWAVGFESPLNGVEREMTEWAKTLPAGTSLIEQSGHVLKTPSHPPSMRAVKQALDPNDILNRGRFVF